MELSISRYKERHWAIYTPDKELVCVCVYKKGARNVVRLMEEEKPLLSSAETAVEGFRSQSEDHAKDER